MNARKPRVVIIAGEPPTEMGHLELVALDFDIVVYHGGKPSPASATSSAIRQRVMSPVIRPRRSGHLHWLYPKMTARLRDDRPDIVHVISEPWGARAVLAAAWADRKSTQVRLVTHGCDRQWFHGNTVERRGKEFLTRFTLTKSEAFVAETIDAALQVRNYPWGRDLRVAAVHTNPRDASLFTPPSSLIEQRSVRRRLGLPETGKGVLFLGRFEVEKGPQLFMACAERVRLSDSSAWFAIGGGGPLGAEIRARCNASGVIFLGDIRYPNGVASVLRAVDFVVVPSITTPTVSEQGPRVVIEAMLSGRRVIGSSAGAIPAMVGGAGRTFPETDVDALVGILSEEIHGEYDARIPRDRAIGLYSTEATAQALSDLWVRLLVGASPPSSPKVLSETQ